MQPLLVRLIKQIAYEAIRATGELPARVPEIRHAPILPDHSTYSPWLSDNYFQIAAERVWGYASRDQLRCYELWSLVRQCQKLGGGALLETGNRRGDTGCLIAQAAAHFGIADRVYFCCEFEGDGSQPIAAGQNTDGGQPAGKASLEALAARLQLGNVEVVARAIPGSETSQRSFRFVHVGADIIQRGNDLEDLWQRLVPGGMLVVSNYGTYGCESLTVFVNELAVRSDSILIHNLNGHGILMKRAVA